MRAAFQLVWVDAALAREKLGYAETARQLRLRLERCDPNNRAGVTAELAAAERREGPTVFDWIVEIIRQHENVDLRFA